MEGIDSNFNSQAIRAQEGTQSECELPSLALSPHGTLYIEESFGRQEVPTLYQGLVDAFAMSSASGILYLASEACPSDLTSAFQYWKELGRLFLAQVCGLSEADAGTSFPPLPVPITELTSFAEALPAMRGSEYIRLETLKTLWSQVDAEFRHCVKQFKAGLKAYIGTCYPSFHLVGRVCFHLAENKRSEETPFAFLATYTTRLSQSATLQHLPLSRALDQYKGEGNRARLLNLLMPIQMASQASGLVKELLDSGELYHPLAWTPKEAFRFLKDIPAFESSGVTVRIPNWWNSKKPPRPEVSIKIGDAKSRGLGVDSMLDFSMSVTLNGEILTESECETLLSATHGLALVRGKWVEIDPEKLKDVLVHWQSIKKSVGKDGISFLEGMRLLSGASFESSGENKTAVASWSNISSGNWLSEALDRLKKPDRLESIKLENFKADLRPYQETGVKWLCFLRRLGIGACLADDMGLGKTIQVIALLLFMQKKTSSPHLLVVPASLIANWKAEIERFAPSINVFIAHPSATPTSQLKALTASAIQSYDVCLTTYGSMSRFSWVSEINWDIIVLDEAQAIKNPNANQTKFVKSLKSRFRIALTGTPVENRLSDLWSIFDYLTPGLLGNAKEFSTFSKRIGSGGQNSYVPLRRLVQPYILRRLKTDKNIIPDLPEKTEVLAYCSLTKLQAALYQQSVESLAREIKEADGIKRRGIILSYLMRFKQICNHPSQWLGDGVYRPSDSGKFSRLWEICDEISQRQERVLVFTQFRETTSVLAKFLEGVFKRTGLVLHGDTEVKMRKKLVDAFQKELGPPFFVLSIKAGGTGLNLTNASHVIHFDRWWNPSVENQATDRAFRIGQQRNVLVHKFVCRGTVEDKIDELIESKKALSQGILEGGSEKIMTEMSNDELMGLVSLDINKALLEG